MAKMIINGEVCSGSTSYASAISYTEEDGSKTTVQDKINELAYRPVNNNILINSNFANPVNQRQFSQDSVTTVETYKYTVDRWYITRPTGTASPKLTLGNGYVTLSGTKAGDGTVSLCQKIEHMPNGVYTVSAKVNGKVYSATYNYTGNETVQWHEDGICLGLLASKGVYITTHLDYIPSANIEWVKLEVGSVATPYVARLYEEEFQLCKRYFRVFLSKTTPSNMDTNLVYSSYPFSEYNCGMRTTPTIIHSSGSVYANGNMQDGFSITYIQAIPDCIVAQYTKNSHGLTSSNRVDTNILAILDAEL